MAIFNTNEFLREGKPSARPSLVLLHFVRKQFVQTFAEDDEAPLATVYGYVPVETVDAVLAKHGGIVNA